MTDTTANINNVPDNSETSDDIITVKVETLHTGDAMDEKSITSWMNVNVVASMIASLYNDAQEKDEDKIEHVQWNSKEIHHFFDEHHEDFIDGKADVFNHLPDGNLKETILYLVNKSEIDHSLIFDAFRGLLLVNLVIIIMGQEKSSDFFKYCSQVDSNNSIGKANNVGEFINNMLEAGLRIYQDTKDSDQFLTKDLPEGKNPVGLIYMRLFAPKDIGSYVLESVLDVISKVTSPDEDINDLSSDVHKITSDLQDTTSITEAYEMAMKEYDMI